MANGNFYFPLYYKNLLAATVGWSNAEFGMYIKLLIYQFDNGAIPEDQLNRIAPGVLRHWNLIGPKFKNCGDGRLQNSFMAEIHDELLFKKCTNSINGSKGGKITQQKNKANGKANALKKQSERLSERGSEPASENKAILIVNSYNKEEEKEEEKTPTPPPGLTSEKIKKVANEVFLDTGWKDAIKAGQNLNSEQLYKWMALFNAALTGDVIFDFSARAYKKMFVGWLHKQKGKGYKIEETSLQQPAAPLKFLN
jgi:uncharacterized protein YdaU (DUF1376 family)